jgi:hypothetical protein
VTVGDRAYYRSRGLAKCHSGFECRVRAVDCQLQIPDLELFSATDLAQVKAVFEHHSIQHVFMGAGLELEQRIEIVRTVFQESKTTVHLKDVASGPQGFLPFARAILIGLQH